MALNIGALRNEWNKLRDALPSKAEVNKVLEPARKEWEKLRDALPSKAEVSKAWEPVRKEWNDVRTSLTQAAQELLDETNAKLGNPPTPESQANEPLTYKDPSNSNSVQNKKEL